MKQGWGQSGRMGQQNFEQRQLFVSNGKSTCKAFHSYLFQSIMCSIHTFKHLVLFYCFIVFIYASLMQKDCVLVDS